MMRPSFPGDFVRDAGRTAVDLSAGTVYGALVTEPSAPDVLVFDSGLGGLTVLAELRAALPHARLVYAADDAAFPYGGLAEDVLVTRVVDVVGRLVTRHRPDLVVIACNTASTLCLPTLRATLAVPVVGTVPAIKPAAAATRSGHVAVLATPGTVKRDYTRALIETFAGQAIVTLVGATGLARLAEAHLKGEAVADAAVLEEIAPCFVERDGRRTDVVVLACTHYPLLIDTFRRVAPWPVAFIDPAPAIARRAAELLGGRLLGGELLGHHLAPPTKPRRDAIAVFTSGATVTHELRKALAQRGVGAVEIDAMPLAR
jgi:glutamate racemase